MRDRLGRWAPWVVAALAWVLALPSIAVGFYADDWILKAELEGRLPIRTPWWDLYRLLPSNLHSLQLARGLAPWWAAPHLHLHFLRPLGSALLAMDHALFGDASLGYHVHSLVWWAALLALARVAFARWLPAPTSTLALAVYAFSTSHGDPVSWLAARHELVATVCVVGGLASMTARGGDGVGRRKGALAAFLLGLATSELAIGGLAFAFMHDLAGPRASPSWTARLRRAAPWGVTAIVYLVGYSALGGGARESGGYVSPMSSPGRFVQLGVQRYPVLLANALVGIPDEFSLVGAGTALFVAGFVAAAVIACVWRASQYAIETSERDAMRWLLPGALLTLVASVGAFPGARVLEIAELGFAALIAVLVRHAFSRGPHAVVRRCVGGLLVALHLGFSPLAVLGNVASAVQIRKQTEAVAEEAATAIQGADSDFVLAASDPMVSVYAPLKLASAGRGHGCWTWIAGAKADVRLTRTSGSTLLIEPVGTTLMHGVFETLYRDASVAFRQGDGASVCGKRVTVARLEDGLPAAIELHADDLDQAAVALLAWQGGALRRIAAPTLGASVVIPWSPGPSGVF
jgi:hypothetical protein